MDRAQDANRLSDRLFMRRALELASRARGRTSPNPLVGAVVVQGGRVIGEGFHERAGAPHAEIVAMRDASGDVRGAALYVTLEPCDHIGRTPPCVPAIIEAGIARVVTSTEDPDPRVRGAGHSRLRAAGIEVDVGVLERESRELNAAYFHRVTSGRSFVAIKAAVTLDGRLATDGGDSRWITGEEARHRGHELRDAYDAVLVGRGTLERDDPRLDVRTLGERRRDPLAVVVDSSLSSPAERSLWNRAKSGAQVLVATTSKATSDRVAMLLSQRVEVLVLPSDPERGVALDALFAALAERGLNSVLVEGGERLLTSVLSLGLASRAHIFVAPSILGGRSGPRLVGDLGIRTVGGILALRDPVHEILGRDVLVTGGLARPGTVDSTSEVHDVHRHHP